VIVLGEEERPGRADLCGDAAQALGVEGLLIGLLRSHRRGGLAVGGHIDPRAVLGADVAALAHALGRVVVLPERLEQGLVGDHARVEDDLHHLGVARATRADLLVGRVRRDPRRIAGGGDIDAGDLPEHPLHAPETAHGQHRHLHLVGIGTLQRMAVDEVGFGRRDRRRAPRQGGVDGRHFEGFGGGGHDGISGSKQNHRY
jgi:hypothetical protein